MTQILKIKKPLEDKKIGKTYALPTLHSSPGTACFRPQK
jgi:hypothetical protein